MNALALFAYYLLLAVGLCIPSDGDHGLLTPKSLSFIGAWAAFLLNITLRRRIHAQSLRGCYWLLLLISFCSLWVMIAMVQGPHFSLEQTIDQTKLFIVTATVPFITWIFVSEEVLSFHQFLRFTILMNGLYCLVKVALIAAHLLGLIDLWGLLEGLGIRAMRMAIFGGLERVQTSVDIVGPFLLFMALAFLKDSPINRRSYGCRGFSSRFLFAYACVVTLSTFFSFSRFLLAVIFISILLHLVSSRRWAVLTSLAVVSAAGAVYNMTAVVAVVEQRLFSDANDASDETRDEQVRLMLAEHGEYPLFGKGLGGYVEGYARDATISHSYEVQWIAFLMQFGIIGLACLLIPLVVLGAALVPKRFDGRRISLFLLYIVWLLGGFTNPFLISLTSGILYTAFIAAHSLSLGMISSSRTYTTWIEENGTAADKKGLCCAKRPN